MTKQELEQAIADLEAGLGNFDGIDFVKRQDRILELRAELGAHALDDVIAKLEAQPEFELGDFRQKVKDARDATKSRQTQVAAFDKAIGILSKALGLALL